MQFTPQEMKLIERLRRQERQWPRARWLLLATGIFVPVCYTPILVRFFGTLRLDETPQVENLVWKLFNFLLFYPTCLIGFCLAAWLITLAIIHWHGNAHRMLLLKLLDAQPKETSRDAHA